MELYILDNNDLTTLSILECSSYEINLDNQFTDKSVFRVNKAAGQIKDNFLVVNGLYQQFLFIIDEVEATDKEEKFVNLVCSDISNIFNRKIIQQDIDLMTTRSIEYFLAHTIDVNFINSDDSFLNKSYIEVTYTGHTQAKEATNAENGIYNFHTFMENCREHHNVFTDFKFEDGKLKITIAYKNDSAVIIDTTLPEVTHYNKVYEQDITAKVQVYIRENDTIQNYYLKTDRTITTNKNDPDRAAGAIEVISVETEDDALQEATNVFKGNTYKHLVEFSMSKNSKLVDTTTLYICRAIRIKTPDGIYDSIISGISLDDDNYINYKSGNIRINFIDKLKQDQENYGNKLDITGGIIKGDLTTEGNATINGNSYISQVNGGDVNIGLNDGTTNFHIHGGNSSQIYWKENDYGDQFRIVAGFGGYDDSNKLYIQGAVGGQGTHPALYDLMTISGKSGNVWHKGLVTIEKPSDDSYFIAKRSDTGTQVGFGVSSSGTNHGIWSYSLGKWLIVGNATTNTVTVNGDITGKWANVVQNISTENNTSSWIPVMNGTSMEHTTVQSIASRTTAVSSSTCTKVGNYIGTVDANKVYKSGRTVQVIFRGEVTTAIPGNTSFVNVPYHPLAGAENAFIIAVGGHYTATVPKWEYMTGNGNIQGQDIGTGNWVHINHTFISDS